MRGFHGAIVSIDSIPAVSLRQLALSRRSTGLGHIDSLVELPGPVSGRLLPSASVGARPASLLAVTVDRPGDSAREALPAHPAEGQVAVPAPRMPLSGGGPATSERQAADEQRPDDEPLSAFLDRRLTAASYLLLPNRSRAYAISKRALDVLVAATLIVLTAPLLVALAVLIRIDSPGPAIFAQDRVTIGGRIFRFYKFRTMHADASQRYPDLYDYRLDQEDFQSAYYKLADDPRNTRVGRWLRRTTLDELPNLFNVLKGDLALVGPRPDLPAFIRLYRPEQLCCLFTKAGLTGVAQVAGRSLLTVGERLLLDMRYVSQQTLLLDLRILWRTAVVVLSGRGAF